MLALYSPDSDTEWLNLEGASLNFTSLKALLCSKLPFTQPISDFTSNPVVLHSIKIWNQVRRAFSLRDLSQATPITKNHMFAPSLIDHVVQTRYDFTVRSVYSHMFWTCPKLGTFWQSIFETFSKIFRKVLAPSPFIALFGVAQMGSALEMCERTMLLSAS